MRFCLWKNCCDLYTDAAPFSTSVRRFSSFLPFGLLYTARICACHCSLPHNILRMAAWHISYRHACLCRFACLARDCSTRDACVACWRGWCGATLSHVLQTRFPACCCVPRLRRAPAREHCSSSMARALALCCAVDCSSTYSPSISLNSQLALLSSPFLYPPHLFLRTLRLSITGVYAFARCCCHLPRLRAYAARWCAGVTTRALPPQRAALEGRTACRAGCVRARFEYRACVRMFLPFCAAAPTPSLPDVALRMVFYSACMCLLGVPFSPPYPTLSLCLLPVPVSCLHPSVLDSSPTGLYPLLYIICGSSCWLFFLTHTTYTFYFCTLFRFLAHMLPAVFVCC